LFHREKRSCGEIKNFFFDIYFCAVTETASGYFVTRVEKVRDSYHRLPETITEVGLDDRGLAVYYRKVSENEYCLWFGTSLGESETHRSATGKWE
jgi:hypothetical protein